MLSFSTLSVSFNSTDYFTLVRILRLTQKQPIDAYYKYSFYSNAYENITESVYSVEGVKDVAITRGPLIFFNSTINGSGVPWILLGIHRPDKISGFNFVAGNYSSNGVYISSELAERLSASVGDILLINLTKHSQYAGKEITTELKLKVAGIYMVDGFAKAVIIHEMPFPTPSEIMYPKEALFKGYNVKLHNENEGIQIKIFSYEQLSLGSAIIAPLTLYDSIYVNLTIKYGELPGKDYTVLVQLDKKELITPWDLDYSMRRIDEILSNVEYKLDHYGRYYYHDAPILYTLRQYSYQTAFLKFSAVIVTIPVLILGGILLVMINWLGVDITARDISLLRIRGTKKTTITGLFALMGFLAGLIGGVLSALIAPFELAFLVNKLFPEEIILYDPLEFALHNLLDNILYSAILGAAFGLIVSLWVGNKASKIDISRYNFGELAFKEEFKFTRHDKILFIIGAYGIFELASGLIVMRTFVKIVEATIILLMVMVAFMIIEIVALSVGPLFFLYSASKLIAGNILKLKRVLLLFVRPFLKDLAHLPIKSLTRNPSRMARVFLILSLALAIAIIYPINTATTINREIIESKIAFGSDIKITGLSIPIENSTIISEAINSVEGVECYALYSAGYYYNAFDLGSIIFVNSTYFNTTYFDESYIEGPPLGELVNLFNQPNTTIITKSLAKIRNLKINDTITLSYSVGDKIVHKSLRVIGIIDFLVGFSSYLFDAQLWVNSIIVSLKYAEDLLENEDIYIDGVFIKAKPNTNVTEVVTQLKNAFKEKGLTLISISTFKDYIHERRLNSFTWVLVLFNESELYIVSIISFITMLIIIFVSMWERKKEQALYIVRGLSKKQLILLNMGEALLISIIGILIAGCVALAFSSASVNNIMMLNSGENLKYPAGYILTIPWYFPIFLISLIASLVLSVLPAYYIIYRREEVLRELRINA